MQSSPPQRAYSRPSSRAESDYELDLDALGINDSNASSPVKPHIDRIRSEDIEGPSDFTLNMEKWMRGGGSSFSRGTVRSLGAKSGRGVLQTLRENDVNARNSQHSTGDRPHLEIPHSPDRKTQHGEEMSRHTPSDSPPKESVWDIQPSEHGEEDGTGDEEHVTSDWNPYASATPAPLQPQNNHNVFLQPTVEDYHSELTPQRPSSNSQHHFVQSTTPATQRTGPRSPEQAHSDAGMEPSPSKMSKSSTPGRPSSPTLSPVRSPIIQRSMSARRASSYLQAGPSAREPELVRQLRDVQIKCNQLSNLNEALKQALNDEQRLRQNEKALHEQQVSYYERREKDLESFRDEAQRRADDFREEFVEQKARLRQSEEKLEVAGREAQEAQKRHENEIEKLKDDAVRSKLDREEENIPKQELDAEREARRRAERSLEMRQQELDMIKFQTGSEQGGFGDVQRLQSELQQAQQTSATTIANLESQLKTARAEASNLQSAKSATEGIVATLRAEVDELRMSRDAETLRISSENDRAAELADGLRDQVADLQKQLRNERNARDDDLARARKEDEAMVNELRKERDDLRDEMEASQSRLNDAIVERDSAQDNLNAAEEHHNTLKETLQSEVDARQDEVNGLKAKIGEVDEVNKALDTQLTAKFKDREAYWRSKVQRLEHERLTMSKALLHQWGREEVGVDRPQAYRYKFMNQSSPIRAGAEEGTA
ncbi:hypothetical protein KC340_g11128 [Hortaea werneckii]|nr:hypothetical protein KC342_g14180 [Hortaea werneckii]KAI7104171.1 hypothetical protein KC339_g4750 [Hortaea werneckii]KAI7233425.1 hypothetical protein KC365_g6384 [Hortaea werneckii]KAI7308135.1 hypothetical protein KC340_g11128 [Hortaea werneckii]KAI7406577.1 hypothetical protein KC328_g924 [Hortaea werneckii]